MEDEGNLHERLRHACGGAGALTTSCLVGAALSLSGAPDAVAWPVAVGAGLPGWWWGGELLRRYERRR